MDPSTADAAAPRSSIPDQVVPVKALLVGAGVALLLSLPAHSMGEHHAQGHHADAGQEHEGGADHHESAAGRPGEPGQVDRVIEVRMSDAMSYDPESVSVTEGRTVRFEVTNEGTLVHEFVIGTIEEILEHHEMMQRSPGMHHEEPNSVSLEPGAAGSVTWQFTEAGPVAFACLEPGHYEAGMKGEIEVGSAS